MQIGFVVPRCRATNSHGRYVIELARRLAVTEDVKVYSGARCDGLTGNGRFQYLPVLDWPMIGRLATVWAASAPLALLARWDVLHTQGADSPIGNVVTAHCCTAATPMTPNGSHRRRFNHLVGSRAERYSLGKSSTRAVIAVSNKVKREIEHHYGIDPAIVTVIRPGVDLGAFHPLHAARRLELRDRLGLRADDFVVIYVGGNYRLKGLLQLVEAARRVGGPIRVLAVGVVPDQALTKALAEDVRSGRVVVKGLTSDMSGCYGMADCFALPTAYDTFSLVTLEAMASGLPVIVSTAAGITERLSHGVDALILNNAADVGVLAEHLGALMSDADQRQRLGAAARQTAEEYSWDRVARETLAVYRSVAA